jgi:Helix-turn-helix domain
VQFVQAGVQFVRAACEHVFVSKYAPRGAPDRTRLEELAKQGATLREIALALDRSVATIRYWLRRWSIPRADARLTRVDPATAPREVMRVCTRHGRAVFRLDTRATTGASYAPKSESPSGGAGSNGSWSRRLAAAVPRAAMTAFRQPSSSTTLILRKSHLASRLAASAAGWTEPAKRLESACSSAGTATPKWRPAYGCWKLPGVDSNHQELINSQSCCRYITGDRRGRA